MMLVTLLSSLNVTVVLSSVIIVALAYLYFITQRGKNLPPGPPCYPFVGNLGQFDPKQGLKDFRVLRKKYGDVFCIMVGHTPMVIVNGMKSLRDIFIGKAELTSDRYPFIAIKAVSKGYGIIGSNGQRWREQRTFALANVRKFGYGKTGLEKPILEEIEVYLKKIEKTDGKPFDLQHFILVSISNNICSLLFGKRFEHDDEIFLKLLHMVHETFKIIGLTNILNYFPFLRHLPGDFFSAKKLLKEQEFLTSYIQELIHEHRKTLDENIARDYIDSFLIAQKQRLDDETSTFKDKQLIETVRDFFFAGTDTTANALLWATLYIANDPKVQAKMKEELDNVVGQSRLPTMNDKAKMPYCDAAMYEIQRLANVSPLALPHAVKEDFEYNGNIIPRNAVLIPNLDSVSRDPELFPDPYKFKPERFLDSQGNLVGKDKCAPFSVGKRMCVGEPFAKMEVFLFLMSMIQKFEFVIDGPVPSFDGHLGLTHTPTPFKVRAIKR